MLTNTNDVFAISIAHALVCQVSGVVVVVVVSLRFESSAPHRFFTVIDGGVHRGDL